MMDGSQFKRGARRSTYAPVGRAGQLRFSRLSSNAPESHEENRMSDEFPLGALVTRVVPFNDRWVEIDGVVAEWCNTWMADGTMA